MFCKKNVLRNFTKFTGKHLWVSVFFKAGSNVFSTKKDLIERIILKMRKIWRKIWPVFMTSKNRNLFSLWHICFLYLLTRSFLKMYIEIESVLFFIIFEWLFERQKQNIAIVTFKYASITWRKIINILHEPRNYSYSTLCELSWRNFWMVKIKHSSNRF